MSTSSARAGSPPLPAASVGLGGLTPSPCHAPDAILGGPTPPPDSPVLGGLPLTIDDFRPHRAPMPPTHMTDRPRRPYATLPKAPFTTYAISAVDDAPRSTRRPRSRTAILDGNAPSRPDYCTAAHSGFAASAASAPLPLRTSPPPRSARLGSTTSTGRLASTSSTPTPPNFSRTLRRLRRPCTRRTRSRTVILDGNAPSCPDYRTAAHSGFAASAASAPPPLRTSPPLRSARLGSATSTGRLASTSSTPTPPDLQSDSPPPTAPLHTMHTKPNRDLGWQCPIVFGLSHGRPQWIRRVRRFCASSAPHVAASAIGPPRLHDLYRSSCLD